jgi:hypothetical protein
MDEREGPNGESLYVATEEGLSGSKGPFLVVYADADGAERWGFLCHNCDTFDNAADAMGRIQCNRCSNLHKAEEWDAAHE